MLQHAEELKAAVSERQVEKMAVDRAWVMAKLTENVQRAMQVEPVQDREGNPTGQYIYQGGVANRALELLGKELGMFQPKPDKDQGSEIHELMARLNAGRDRVAKEKRERDAAAADSTNLLRRESEHSRIVGAEKNIGTHEPVGDMADPADLIPPFS
jgi:hypothetical protein